VCWLEPEQTAGKLKPYVFTQGQAVLNRSFFPCFDTPAVKSTYSAAVQVRPSDQSNLQVEREYGYIDVKM